MHNLELEVTIRQFNDAVDTLNRLPPGDERSRRLVQLEKSKSLILHADRLSRDKRPIMELIQMAKENIEKVLDFRVEKATMLPPRPLIKVEEWKQLDLPFNPPIK